MKRTLLYCLCAALLLCGCAKPKTIDGDTAYVRNPDCGFYTPVGVSCTAQGVACNLNGLLIRNNLLHLRVDLSGFAAEGSALTAAALDGLTALFDTLRENSVNAVVRFAYDKFDGKADREPPLKTVVGHIEQLAGILRGYPDVLTAVEAGMIGPWGEMHSSKTATKESFNAVLGAWLKNTHADTRILARRPQMVADYIGIDVSDLRYFTALAGTEAYRLGVFNDGYLGSENDLGTYVDRVGEVAWLSRQAAHTPFGGEVTIPGSELNKIEYAAAEMFSTHTAYLNALWNDEVIAEWKRTPYTEAAGPDKEYHGLSAYVYIRDHLGYRLTLDEVILPERIKGNFKVTIRVRSDGFGNLIKPKTSELIFKNDAGVYAVAVDLDPASWTSGASYKSVLKANTATVPAGEYTVYLRMREPSSPAPLYAIAFSNGLFDEEVLGNRLGALRVNG